MLPPAGHLLWGFLEALTRQDSPSLRRESLKVLFRWYLRIEGLEEGRLAKEELELWRGRFYGLLPATLRTDFPWDVPATLPPHSLPKVGYPRYHTPLRQYGFIAARAVDLVAMTEPAQQAVVLPVLLGAMVSLSRHHGYEATPAVTADHIASLSGGTIRIDPAQVAGLVQREPSPEARQDSPRAKGKLKRRPYWRRK